MSSAGITSSYHAIGTVTTGLRRFLPIRYGRDVAFKTRKIAHGPFINPMLEQSSLLNAHGHLAHKF